MTLLTWTLRPHLISWGVRNFLKRRVELTYRRTRSPTLDLRYVLHHLAMHSWGKWAEGGSRDRASQFLPFQKICLGLQRSRIPDTEKNQQYTAKLKIEKCQQLKCRVYNLPLMGIIINVEKEISKKRLLLKYLRLVFSLDFPTVNFSFSWCTHRNHLLSLSLCVYVYTGDAATSYWSFPLRWAKSLSQLLLNGQQSVGGGSWALERESNGSVKSTLPDRRDAFGLRLLSMTVQWDIKPSSSFLNCLRREWLSYSYICAKSVREYDCTYTTRLPNSRR